MSANPTKAIVLAAGLGTRMRPLTDSKPKALLPVAGKTLVDRALDWLDTSGINEVVVNSFYKADMLEAHVLARANPKIIISREDVLLETGGGIKHALPLLGNAPFFSVNSDVICLDGKTPALQRLQHAWDDSTMDALLLVHPTKEAIGFDGPGDFFVEHGGIVRRRQTNLNAPYVFTGIQLLHPRLFAHAPDGVFSLNLLYNKDMAPDGTLSRVRALAHDGSWLHVGDPAGLKLAEAWLALHC